MAPRWVPGGTQVAPCRSVAASQVRVAVSHMYVHARLASARHSVVTTPHCARASQKRASVQGEAHTREQHAVWDPVCSSLVRGLRGIHAALVRNTSSRPRALLSSVCGSAMPAGHGP